MRVTLLVVFVLISVVGPVAKADDKGRFGLAKFNPFRKKDDPAAKSKLLTDALRTDPDEKKRKAAAEELRETDAKQISEILPVLTASLKQDPSANVRAVVAETIGKLKPVSPNAGAVLEAAAANDPSETVRKSAQAAVWAYQVNGYKPTAPSATTQTGEPPLAKPRPKASPVPTRQIYSPPQPAATSANPLGVPSGINRGPVFGETGEPPLAKTRASAVQPPMPQIPVPPMPAEMPKAVPPVGMIPTPLPLPLPAAPKLPQAMPAVPVKGGAAPTIPTPPPSSNPGF